MKVITMGEIMLRLSTPGNRRFVQSDSFDVVYGGGEANVAISLANYGHESYFVSKLPDNEIGQSAVNTLRKFGVKKDYILRGGDRIGIYYLETGASMRASKVIYDRAESAFSKANYDEYDFDGIFEDSDWFHFSGITAAISETAAKLCEVALIAAKNHGVTVSCDLNYRKKLWTAEEAQKVMIPLMKYVDVCIGNEEDAEKCLGYNLNVSYTSGNIKASDYYDLMKRMQKDFNFELVVSTLRESFSASENGWKALGYYKGEYIESSYYTIKPIVDRVGGGDSFSAGIIHGMISDMNIRTVIEFAVAASALKQTIPGDYNLVSISEVETLMNGDKSGRVVR